MPEQYHLEAQFGTNLVATLAPKHKKINIFNAQSIFSPFLVQKSADLVGVCSYV